MAIGSLDIKDGVQFLNILAGVEDFPSNAAAQLGKITVGGDRIASNIAAGIDPVDTDYGDGDDIAIGGMPGASNNLIGIPLGATGDFTVIEIA